MKRFDVTIEGHQPLGLKKEYCEDGAFVDADMAEEMLITLESIIDAWDWTLYEHNMRQHIEMARKLVMKVKGEESD